MESAKLVLCRFAKKRNFNLMLEKFYLSAMSPFRASTIVVG